MAMMKTKGSYDSDGPRTTYDMFPVLQNKCTLIKDLDIIAYLDTHKKFASTIWKFSYIIILEDLVAGSF